MMGELKSVIVLKDRTILSMLDTGRSDGEYSEDMFRLGGDSDA